MGVGCGCGRGWCPPRRGLQAGLWRPCPSQPHLPPWFLRGGPRDGPRDGRWLSGWHLAHRARGRAGGGGGVPWRGPRTGRKQSGGKNSPLFAGGAHPQEPGERKTPARREPGAAASGRPRGQRRSCARGRGLAEGRPDSAPHPRGQPPSAVSTDCPPSGHSWPGPLCRARRNTLPQRRAGWLPLPARPCSRWVAPWGPCLGGGPHPRGRQSGGFPLADHPHPV